jgi:hypothetical protein
VVAAAVVAVDGFQIIQPLQVAAVAAVAQEPQVEHSLLAVAQVIL